MLEPLSDSAVIGDGASKLAFTTDSFVVRPLFFPGGDIGELAVNGTVNDLAMAGARPIALSAGFIVEEGLAVADLDRIVGSMARAAEAAGVQVATGDTKVVERGKADGLYINTSGVGTIEHEARARRRRDPGRRPGDRLGPDRRPRDGDHDRPGRARPRGRPRVRHRAAQRPGRRRCSRRPTGSAACATRPAAGSPPCSPSSPSPPSWGSRSTRPPPDPPEVNGACEILGIDPLYVANEGKLVAIVAPEAEDDALAALRAHPSEPAPSQSPRSGPIRRAWFCSRPPSAALGSSTCWPGTLCRGSAERWRTHRSSVPGAAPRSATSSTSTSRGTRRLPSRRARKGRSRRRSRSGSRRCSQASPSPASAPAASASTTWSPTGRANDVPLLGGSRTRQRVAGDEGEDRAGPRAAVSRILGRLARAASGRSATRGRRIAREAVGPHGSSRNSATRAAWPRPSCSNLRASRCPGWPSCSKNGSKRTRIGACRRSPRELALRADEKPDPGQAELAGAPAPGATSATSSACCRGRARSTATGTASRRTREFSAGEAKRCFLYGFYARCCQEPDCA